MKQSLLVLELGRMLYCGNVTCLSFIPQLYGFEVEELLI